MKQHDRRQFHSGSISTNGQGETIRHLVKELMGKARELQSSFDHMVQSGSELDLSSLARAEAIRKIVRVRARRNEFFPTGLFADPAWDILLNLYASYLEQRREAIGGLVSMAGVPPTTGLRWVHKLVEEGMIVIHDDPLDQRRKYVELTEDTLQSIDRYFRSTGLLTV